MPYNVAICGFNAINERIPNHNEHTFDTVGEARDQVIREIVELVKRDYSFKGAMQGEFMDEMYELKKAGVTLFVGFWYWED